MSRNYTDTFDRANGSLGSPWQVLSGTFSISNNLATSSTAPGSNPLAAVEIGLRSNGRADMTVEALAGHVYGNAVYGRVVDINNWIRARVHTYTSTYSYQYYVTEYQHASYSTEYLINDYYYEYRHTTYGTEYEYYRDVITGCTYSGWSSWQDTGSPTACRQTSPSPPADQYTSGCTSQATTQYRYVNAGQTPFCSSVQTTFQLQYRTQSATHNYSREYTWSTSSSLSGWSRTGNTRSIVTNQYWDTNPSGSDASRTTYAGQYWSSSSNPPSPDTYAGSTRQVVSGYYWDTNYEAGAPTRQAGPYTGYGTDYWYGSLSLEKRVGGTITEIGSWQGSDSTANKILKLTCNGSTLSVSWGGTTRITVTDSSHINTGTKAGIGGGTSSYNANTPSLNNFTAAGISIEKVRLSTGAWGTMNKKVRVGSSWVDVDSLGR